MLFQRAANTCSGEADCRSGNGGASFGLEGRHLLDDLLVRIGEWHVFAFGMLQQRHHRDGKSANGCGDGPFPGVFAPTLGDAQTLELQVGHADAVPERHLRGLRQECSKKRRAGFRDRQLLVDVAGLVLSRDEPEVRTDVTRLGEPRVVAAEDGDVGDRAEEAYADHLADALYVGGGKIKDVRPMQERLRGIMAIELPKESFAQVSEDQKASIKAKMEQAEKNLDVLIDDIRSKGYTVAVNYLERAKHAMFGYVRRWLALGLVCPRASSFIERTMRAIGRRIKKLGYNWKDKGVGKIARIVLKLFATEGEWEEYWRKRMDLNQSVMLNFKILEVQ